MPSSDLKRQRATRRSQRPNKGKVKRKQRKNRAAAHAQQHLTQRPEPIKTRGLNQSDPVVAVDELNTRALPEVPEKKRRRLLGGKKFGRS